MTEQQQRALAAGVRALAESTKDASASAAVEAAIREIATAGRLKPAATGSATYTRTWFTHATAAALLIASISGAWLARRANAPAGPIHPSGFVEIPGASALPPMESGSIIRVALTVGELPQYGFAIVPEWSADHVQADLLVAQDGVPRAIRLVHDGDDSRSTP